MDNVARAARAWHAAGVSTIPISTNGTKKPAVKWAEWQLELPTTAKIDEWWMNGQQYGLALIMGKVSGNLEMLELEARVCEDPENLLAIEAAAERLGVLDKWYRLVQEGYMEESPSGGLHFIYKIHDHPVPGNEKVARRPATADELIGNPMDKIKVLSETRGEGGYVIVAPTSGLCHPLGQQWTKLHGNYGEVVSLLWETRCLIHQAVREALDIPVVPVPASVPASPANLPAGTGHMWDSFDVQADFPTLLRERGWTPTRSGREWTRPGKDPRDGTSATLDHDGTGRLFVFSTSSGLETDRYFSPFEFLAYHDFGGDIKRALRELRIITPNASIEELTFTDWVPPPPERNYSHTETGNAQRLSEKDGVRGKYHWVHEVKGFYRYDGTRWKPDDDGALTREWISIAEGLSNSPDEATGKWGKNSLSNSKISGTLNLFKSVKGVTKSISDFNTGGDYLTVQNGTLNLKTQQLHPHDPKYMDTRMVAAKYDPQATCPNWDTFMEQTVPDPVMRAYIQRAAGYSLLGTSDQRSLFVLHGPTGTGKSTFLETIKAVLGEYAIAAPAGTFKAKREAGPSNDLHAIRGRRFVVTSETAEHSNFDEELLKRLTGKDSMQSRGLYEAFQEWKPECVVWIATNHAPRFSSDDDAVWRRMKLIHFPNPVDREAEIPGMVDRVLLPEAAGILNWLLAGLRSFLEVGLDEPEMVAAAAGEVRRSSDSVARFMDEVHLEGRLVYGDDETIKKSLLYRMYQEWCRTGYERPLNIRRFQNRIDTLFIDSIRESGSDWVGIRHNVSIGYSQNLMT